MRHRIHVVLVLFASLVLAGCSGKPITTGAYQDTNSQTVITFSVRADGTPIAECESPRGIWISPYKVKDSNTIEIPQLHRYPITIVLTDDRASLVMNDLDGKAYKLLRLSSDPDPNRAAPVPSEKAP